MKSRNETPPSAPRSTRVRVAQALGLIALVASLIGALGPAERVRTMYSWPPTALSAKTPTRVWYTPLLLATHEPELISVDVPCRLPPLLPNGEPGYVLGTARYPDRAGGLTITQSATQLIVRLGKDELDRVALPAGGGLGDCAHRVTIAAGSWSISGGGEGLERQGAVAAMPTVYGLFTALDLRSSARFSVDVTSSAHATRTTLRQTIAWSVAVLAALCALLLVAFERRPRRPWAAVSGFFRGGLSAAHPADAVVLLALLAWCVIAPVNFDDGWVIQREQMFETSKGFSVYYSNLAVNLPLDYWLEWVHHWLAEASAALLVFRVPVFLVLMVAWVLCRWMAARIQATAERDDRINAWILACAFLFGSLAWGMTMRPEPVTALFVTGVTACVVRFLTRESAAPLALAAVLAALALTAHPAGVVSLAAVIVAGPRVFAWARSQLAPAVTIVSASSALLATLAFVGADLDQRVADADTTQETSVPGRDELQRYAYLWEEPFGTPLRRAFVALILLAVLAFVLRRQRARRGLLDFPAMTLGVGLVLLVATPSKWPSHFGALVGIGALAIAAESARLRSDGRRSAGWQAWPLLAIGAAFLAATWSWWERDAWNPLDLRTLAWETSAFGLAQLAVLMPLLLLAGALLVSYARGQRAALHRVPWRVASWIPAALAVPAILFTVGVLVVDAARTPSWTVIRQNLESVAGDSGCGLADDVLVSRRASARPLPTVETRDTGSLPAWVPASPVPGLSRFVLGPAGNARAISPWFELPSNGRTGVFVSGTPGPSDTLWIEWGRASGDTIESLETDDITEVVSEQSGSAPWRFFAAGDLPNPAPGATAARIEYRASAAPGVALAVTSPVTYSNERLVAVMDRESTRTLVYPELYLYFPCTNLPALRDGSVEVPQHVVIGKTESPPLRYHVTSPFVGLLDLYELERVPVADSEDRVDRLRVFAVDRRISGAGLAPPTRTTIVS